MRNNKNSMTTFYNVILFLYVALFPLIGTILIPKEKTFVFFPLVLIIFNLSIIKNITILFRNKINTSLICFFVVVLFSLINITNLNPAITQLVNYLIIYAFFVILIIYSLLDSRNSMKIVIFGLLVSVIYSVVISYFQFLGDERFYIYEIDKLNDNTQINSNVDLIRIWGTWGNSLTFSNYLSVAGIITSVYLLFIKSKFNFLASIIIFLVVILGLILSGGRIATLSFVLIYFIGFWAYSKWNKKVIICTGLIFFILIFGFYNNISKFDYFYRYLNVKEDFQTGRVDNWELGVKVFKDSPIFGTGVGNLNTKLSEKFGQSMASNVKNFYGGHVESVYFTILATYGIIGFFSFLLIIFYSLKSIIKISHIEKFKEITYPFIFGWIVMLINMITNPAFIFEIKIGFIFVILIMPAFISRFAYDKQVNYLKKQHQYNQFKNANNNNINSNT